MLRAVRACPSCGRANADDARFCASCGAALERGCARCGAELAPDARFCSSCVAPVEPAADTPAPPAGQERRLVTILFADVTGSTGLGERLDPEQLQDVLASYFSAMREEIEAEGGTVEKFIGDAVMAAFGVPTAHEDDAIRAVRAALRMRRRLPSLNEELFRRHEIELQIRTGVNTGEVLASTDPRPGEPMVTGDAVNVAARLEQSAEPGEIVVSERTSRAARRFRYRPLADREVRGRSTPVPAVVLLEEAPDRLQRGIPGLRAPIVGRDRELDVLRSVLERSAQERRPHLVTIYGEPGVGKSRLVHEFVERQDGDVVIRTLRGRCLPYGDGVAYWPLAEILKGWADIYDDDDPAAVREKIAAATASTITERFHPEPVRAAAALAHTLGVEHPTVRFDDLDPRRVRDEVHAAWRSFFSALAAVGPILVVVEDIHWADPALLDLLEDLAERVVGPAVFLCPSRPELVEHRPGWGGGRRNVSSIALDPLSTDDAHRLIELLLAVDDLPVSLRERILARAEGNPFFLEEIVRHLIDEGRIERSGDRWRAAPGIGDVEVPDTVQAVLAARIDLLDAPHKRALQRAAVVGRVFWPSPVRRLLNGDAEHLDDALERFEERDLVLPRLGSSFVGEREFIFKHVLTAQVAYDSLPRRERAEAHAEVARWLEETAGERREEFVELLAHHYGSAYRGARDQGEDIEALRADAYGATLAAAVAMRRKVAFARAARLAEEAAELAPTPSERATALDVLGRGLRDDHRGDESYRAFRAAVDLLLEHAPDDERIPILCALTVEIPTRWPGIMMSVPPVEEIVPYLEAGLERMPPGDTEAGVRLLGAKSFLPFATFGAGFTDDELDEAYRLGSDAAAMALRLGRYDLASGALDGVIAVRQMQGRYAEIVDRDTERLALAEHIDDPAEIADMRSAAASSRISVGRFREALALADHGVEVAFEEAPSYGVYSLVWSLVAAFRLGEWDDALARFRRLERYLAGREPTRPWLQAYAIAAFVADARGNPVEADRLLTPVLEGAPTQRYRSVTGASWVVRLLARRGEHVDARRWADEMTLPESNVLAVEVRCEQLAEEGAWGRVDETLAFAEAVRERSGSPLVDAARERLLGRVAAANDDHPTAIEHHRAAAAIHAATDARWELACEELAIAEVALASGRIDEARGSVAVARPDLERAGSLRELQRANAVTRATA
jgi:class 3 adenylate cyclase